MGSWPRRSPCRRPEALRPEGGRGHEPGGLALDRPRFRPHARRPGPGRGIARATIDRQRPPAVEPPRRPGPSGPTPDGLLVEAIRAAPAGSGFPGEGYRKIRARPRFAGIRAPRRRGLRLMRGHGLLAPRRPGAARGPRSHDGTLTTERGDAVWGADLTSAMTGEGRATPFIAVDRRAAERGGIHAARRATRFEALGPLRQGVRQRFGGFAQGSAAGRAVRHDHGSRHVAHDLQQELAFLGIASPPPSVRAPEGNGRAERFIRTLKEDLPWLRPFETVEELRRAVLAFEERHNHTRIVERHGYKTPARVSAERLHPAALAA